MELFGFCYAAIVATGGVIGYVKAGSSVSLAMGLVFGGLSALGAYQMSNDPMNTNLLMGTSGVLLGVMGYRFIKSGKFMPAGLVAALSLVLFIRLVMIRLLSNK